MLNEKINSYPSHCLRHRESAGENFKARTDMVPITALDFLWSAFFTRQSHLVTAKCS